MSRWNIHILFLALFLYCLNVQAQDYTCSPTKPCSLGCCSKTGVCGLGPTYCAPANCTSSCDAKSECDPGWGSQWSTASKCPLNVCCSQYGFCGTTKEFCGTKTVTKPSCNGNSARKRTIGYYEGWSLDRTCDTITPEEIPIGAYTHINFAFAFIDPVSFKVAPMQENQVKLYKRTTALKRLNPGMEVWISIGGWSMNDPDQPTAKTFSQLAASATYQDNFFRSLVSFMETYGFDGVDIDWEYPVAEERSGTKADFNNFTSFLRNLKRALGASGHKYGLTITIPTSYWYMRHFDIVEQAKIVDWFNIMSYDLHGTWDSTNKYIGSIVGAHTNLTEIDSALELLWRNNIKPEQVVLGLGLYGRSFTLANPSCNKPGCSFTGGANAGKCTANVGTLSYAEILRVINSGATVSFLEKEAVKQAVWGGNQWVSYDDAQTLGMKIDYANKLCLGGTMVWAVSQDTKDGAGAAAISKGTNLFPGSGQSDRAQASLGAQPEAGGQCFITDCYAKPTCPSGWGAVQQTNGDRQDVNIGNGCGKGLKRTYCCPLNDMPTCYWKGSAPLCTAKCDAGDLELTYDTKGCDFNHKTLCCKKTTSGLAITSCVWKGTAPLCSRDNSCPSDKPNLIARSNTGDNQKPCDFDLLESNLKVWCCSNPSPYNNCVWYTKDDTAPSTRPYKCTGKCPSGKVLAATDNYCFGGGTRALCCDNPSNYNDGAVTEFKKNLIAFRDPLSCPSTQTRAKRDLETLESRDDIPGDNVTVSADVSLVPKDAEKESRALQERDFKNAGGYSFLRTVLGILKAQTYAANLMRQAYEEFLGNINSFHIVQIIQFLDAARDTETDDERNLMTALCEGTRAQRVLTDIRSHTSQLCTYRGPNANKKKRDLAVDEDVDSVALNQSSETSIDKRWFDVGNALYDPPTFDYPNPFTGSIMRAVATGNSAVRFLYGRRIDIMFGNTPQIIVEVAYDIRNAPQLQQTIRDAFAVFHFHIDGLTQDMTRVNVRSINVFHAQAIGLNYATRDWRVDGRNGGRGDNARAHIMDCEDDTNPDINTGNGFAPGGLYQGTFTDGSRQIIALGERLYNERILHIDNIPYDPVNRRVVHGATPEGQRESMNFGRNGEAPVDLSTQNYPDNGPF